MQKRQERQGRNPRTGDVITIAASRWWFRPGKMLKDALNKWRKQMLHGETIHSPFLRTFVVVPDFAVFFGVLYLVLFVIGTGVGYVILRSIWDTCRGGCGCHGEEHPAERSCLPFSESRLSSSFCLQVRCFVALLGKSISQRGVMTNARSLSERRRL